LARGRDGGAVRLARHLVNRRWSGRRIFAGARLKKNYPKFFRVKFLEKSNQLADPFPDNPDFSL
jgi:hypothetical protein